MEFVETPDSSNIRRFGYDGSHLVVDFRSGGTWEYDAPRKVFEEMKKAKSAGTFLHAQVKNKYAGRKRD